MAPISLFALELTVDGSSTLHADRFVATFKASEGVSPELVVTCCTQPFRGRPGCLHRVCQAVLSPALSRQKDVEVDVQQQPSPYA